MELTHLHDQKWEFVIAEVTVGLVDGLLALAPLHNFGFDNELSNAVWVMKEYGVAESWTELFDVRTGEFYGVIGFTKGGEVLVDKFGRLFSCGPSSREYLEDPPICDLENMCSDTYVESLVLLNVADRVSGLQGNSSSGSMCTKKRR